MRKIEILAIIVIILYLLSFAAPFASTFFLVKLYGAAEFNKISVSAKLVSVLLCILRVLVHIVIGEWLYFLARKERHATPGVWCVFGLFFGLIAVILYYLIKIYETMKPEEG